MVCRMSSAAGCCLLTRAESSRAWPSRDRCAEDRRLEVAHSGLRVSLFVRDDSKGAASGAQDDVFFAMEMVERDAGSVGGGRFG